MCRRFQTAPSGRFPRSYKLPHHEKGLRERNPAVPGVWILLPPAAFYKQARPHVHRGPPGGDPPGSMLPAQYLLNFGRLAVSFSLSPLHSRTASFGPQRTKNRVSGCLKIGVVLFAFWDTKEKRKYSHTASNVHWDVTTLFSII